MALGPRFVFTRFGINDGVKAQLWRHHVERLVGAGKDATPLTAPAPHGVVWSLVSGNNRELARGVEVFGLFADATTAADLLVLHRSSLEGRDSADAGHGRYGWFAVLDGAPAMVASRWYDTDRDRRAAMASALGALATARLNVGTRMVAGSMPTDRR